MALIHNNVTVGTTPTVLVQMPVGVGLVPVQIQNRDSATIYIGDANVAVASGVNGGHTLATNGNLQIWMRGNETLYAISAAGTSTGAVSLIYSA